MRWKALFLLFPTRQTSSLNSSQISLYDRFEIQILELPRETLVNLKNAILGRLGHLKKEYVQNFTGNRSVRALERDKMRDISIWTI